MDKGRALWLQGTARWEGTLPGGYFPGIIEFISSLFCFPAKGVTAFSVSAELEEKQG